MPDDKGDGDGKAAANDLGAGNFVPFPPQNLSYSKLDEVGVTGLVHYGWNVYEEWHKQLQGIRGVRAYREMGDNDSTVGASFGAIESMVRLVKWFPEVADHPRGQEAADFLQSVIDDMSHTWHDFTGEAVVGQLTFGWSMFEKVYKYRKGPGADPKTRSKHTDGKMGFRKLAPRAQETLDGWEFDEDGGIFGMYQRAAPAFQRVFLPISKCVLFRPRSIKNNPEGRSLLRNAYRAWFFVKRLEELEAIGIERDLVGLPKMELPAGWFDKSASPDKKAAVAAYAQTMAQVRRNEHEGLTLPSETLPDGKASGFKFSLVNSGGTRAIPVGEAVERHRAEMAQVMLTQFIFLGMNGRGTQALSESLVSLFSVSLSVVLDTFEETFQRYGVDELMELNGYPIECWPKWRHGDVEKKDVRPMAESLLKLVDGGLVTPDDTLEDYLRNEMRLPDKPDPDEVDGEGGDGNGGGDDDDALESILDGASGAATNVDAGTMVDRLASAIERLVGVEDYDLANTLRDAMAGMLGMPPPSPLVKPDPLPAPAIDPATGLPVPPKPGAAVPPGKAPAKKPPAKKPPPGA